MQELWRDARVHRGGGGICMRRDIMVCGRAAQHSVTQPHKRETIGKPYENLEKKNKECLEN